METASPCLRLQLAKSSVLYTCSSNCGASKALTLLYMQLFPIRWTSGTSGMWKHKYTSIPTIHSDKKVTATVQWIDLEGSFPRWTLPNPHLLNPGARSPVGLWEWWVGLLYPAEPYEFEFSTKLWRLRMNFGPLWWQGNLGPSPNHLSHEAAEVGVEEEGVIKR